MQAPVSYALVDIIGVFICPCNLQEIVDGTELCQVDLSVVFVKTTTAADGICVRFVIGGVHWSNRSHKL